MRTAAGNKEPCPESRRHRAMPASRSALTPPMRLAYVGCPRWRHTPPARPQPKIVSKHRRLAFPRTCESQLAGRRCRLSTRRPSRFSSAARRKASPFDALTSPGLVTSQPRPAPPANHGTPTADSAQALPAALASPAAEAVPLLGQAVQLDPEFGRAWILLTRTYVALGDRIHAQDAIAQAREHKIPAIDQAWLNFESAALGNDRSASLVAMSKVADLDLVRRRSCPRHSPQADRDSRRRPLRRRGCLETAAERFLLADDANRLESSFRLYALLEQRRIPGALPPRSPNHARISAPTMPIHSIRAETSSTGAWKIRRCRQQLHAAANAKMPGALEWGRPLAQEAWRRLLAGDKNAADSLMDQLPRRSGRSEEKDPTIDLWAPPPRLYRTGRAQEAVALAAQTPRRWTHHAGIPYRSRGEIAAQLAVWDLLADDRAAAAKMSLPVGQPASRRTIFWSGLRRCPQRPPRSGRRGLPVFRPSLPLCAIRLLVMLSYSMAKNRQPYRRGKRL